MTTTNSELPEITGGNGQEHTDHNLALRMLDLLIQHAVVDHSLTTAPGSPTEGSCYVIATNGGAWSGFTTGNLAGYINGAWVELPVRNGHRVVSDIDGELYEKSGSSWSQITIGGVVQSVNGATGTVVLDPDDLDDSATTNKFTTAAEITKLAGIEAAADVTDETNVVAALSGATLTDLGTPAATDRILLQDADDSGNLKTADFSEFAGSVDINGLTEEIGFTSGDFLVFYDTTAGTNRKVDYDDLPGGGSNFYDVIVGFDATPTSSEVVTTVPIAREVTFPADFSGAVGTINTNPTATMVLSVKDDGTEIGQVSISTGGAFTFTTTSGTAKVVAAGSILTLVGPGTADATAAGCAITLAGTA